VVDPAEVIARDPEVILASWCGMKVKKAQIVAREGWNRIAAVQRGHIYEIPGTCILQPGPASLTEGVRQLHAVLAHGMRVEIAPGLKPAEQFETL
jgi:iron complex transport system substrate-binding protein